MFMQHNGITSSQFADTCEISRPTLSQLLNGRNKKVSDEVISKIHRAYPTLNILWLMFGDGEMIVPNPNGSALSSETELDETRGKTTVHTITRENSPRQTTIRFGNTDYQPQKPVEPSFATGPLDTPTRPAMSRPASRGGSIKTPDDGRTVVGITVFYSDGRFESFVPAQ